MMINKALRIIQKFAYIVWYNRHNEPLQILKQTYQNYKNGGRKTATKGINNAYKALTKEILESMPYEQWIQRKEHDIFENNVLDYSPLISIITPTYNTPEPYLKAMIESVRNQTYTHWQLCIADDASTESETRTLLQHYQKKHDNIDVHFRETNGHISQASNSALALAKGDYIVLLDHDDTLAPNALYEMVKKLNENRELKLIYSDEDKIDEHNRRFDPHFKSSWNPAMFFSHNYICHLTLLNKELVNHIGGFRQGYEGSQDYDLFLRYIRLIEAKEIAHIDKILYHWRAIQGSTALDSQEKNYTHDSGLRALQDYFTQQESNIEVKEGLLPNTYKVNYPLPDPLPLVTLLIPTRDGYEILKQCIESIFNKTTYDNYEIIILDNESRCERTLNYFNQVQEDPRITILPYPHPFNYSAINNYGVQHAKGTLIGLINNDIEVINPHWLTEVVSHALREEIGAVGAKLYYSNDTIQHAGVILGIGGVAGHSHKYFDRDHHGYFSRLKIIQNFSAVTAACLIVRKELFDRVNGLEEEHLTVAFNDIDFCLKLDALGYRSLWTPYAELYHHESLSRGAEDTPEKQARFESEMRFMKEKWGTKLLEDKCYNSNLSLEHENFSLKRGV